MKFYMRILGISFIFVSLVACGSQQSPDPTATATETATIETPASPTATLAPATSTPDNALVEATPGPTSTDLPSSLSLIGMPVVGDGVVFTVMSVTDFSESNQGRKLISIKVRIKNTGFTSLEITPDRFVAIGSNDQQYFADDLVYTILTRDEPFLPQGAQELVSLPFGIDAEEEPITLLYTPTEDAEPLPVRLEQPENLRSQIFPELNLETILITDADMEFGVVAGEFSTDPPGTPLLFDQAGIEQPNYYASQLIDDTNNSFSGFVLVFVYDLVESVDAQYTHAEQNLIFSEKQEINQLGESALLAETPDASLKRLTFTRCQGFVSIFIGPLEANQNWSNEDIISYARNLDKRLSEEICS